MACMSSGSESKYVVVKGSVSYEMAYKCRDIITMNTNMLLYTLDAIENTPYKIQYTYNMPYK